MNRILYRSLLVMLTLSAMATGATWFPRSTGLAAGTPPPFRQALVHAGSKYTAPIQVAMVFGRSQGCDNADPELVQLVAQAAQDAGLDPRVAAATVAVESACNPLAVSRSGAVGAMQVMPKIWNKRYDFENTVNLFNTRDNLRVGTEILAGLIKQYGLADGVRHYNGMGTDCAACDPGYSSRILSLARVGKD